jgi:hypothetical protein
MSEAPACPNTHVGIGVAALVFQVAEEVAAARFGALLPGANDKNVPLPCGSP